MKRQWRIKPFSIEAKINDNNEAWWNGGAGNDGESQKKEMTAEETICWHRNIDEKLLWKRSNDHQQPVICI